MRLGVSVAVVASVLVMEGCSGGGDNNSNASPESTSSTAVSKYDYSDFKRLMSRYFREVYFVEYDFAADFDDTYEWIRKRSKTDPIVPKDVKSELSRKTPRSDSIDPEIVELTKPAAIPALRFAAACRLLHMVDDAFPKPIPQMVEQARILMGDSKGHAKYPALEKLPSTHKFLEAMQKYCVMLSKLPGGDRDACPGKCLNWLIGYILLPVVADTVEDARTTSTEFVNSLNSAYTGILSEKKEQVRPFARAMIMLENLFTASEFQVQEGSLQRGFHDVSTALQEDG